MNINVRQESGDNQGMVTLIKSLQYDMNINEHQLFISIHANVVPSRTHILE